MTEELLKSIEETSVFESGVYNVLSVDESNSVDNTFKSLTFKKGLTLVIPDAVVGNPPLHIPDTV